MNAKQINHEIQCGLEANGCITVADWLHELAAQNGVPYQEVKALALLLGPGELFDGLVSAVQDRSEEL